MHPAARAVFVQLQPVGVVATVFGRRIRALAALAAGEVDDYAVLFLWH
jgi:hypothetical protein